MKETYRHCLREVALDQYGYVTTHDADRLGIPKIELQKLAHRGGLSNVGWGLYRFDDIPVTARDHYMEAVLWVGRDALLSADAVLALYQLGQVNPKTLHVVTPHRVRRTGRRDIQVSRRAIPDAERTRYFGIPATTILRAFLDARDMLMPIRLREAAEQARTEGLLTAAEYKSLGTELARA